MSLQALVFCADEKVVRVLRRVLSELEIGMDTFVDSSWYFYRYTDARNDQAPFDSERAGYWFGDRGIDQYIGGVEHAILHLIYSRFWTKMMRDLGLVNNDEPVARMLDADGIVVRIVECGPVGNCGWVENGDIRHHSGAQDSTVIQVYASSRL